MTDTQIQTQIQTVVVQGDVTLTASVLGVEDGTAASFEIHKVEDDSVVATVQGEVQGGTAECSWDPELSPEGEARGVRIYYIVTAGEQTTRSQELEVYLDTLDITSVDEEDAALPDVPYRVIVGDTDRQGTTGSTGTFREGGLPAGELQFEWRGPYELIEWVDETGPTRKAKLKKVDRLRFLWPNPENQGGKRLWLDDGTEVELLEKYHAHTQWVNLTPDTALPEQGSRMTFSVAHVEREHGKAGSKVFVKAEWPAADHLSKRNDPVRALVGGDTKPWATGDTCKGLELAFEEDGGEVTFEVELGKAGADVVTLHLGCTDRCDDAKIVVTNRRKLWYQTTRLASQALVDLNTGDKSTRAWLDAVAVDLEPEPDLEWTDAPALDGPVAERGLAKVPKSWLTPGAEGDAAIVGSHNWEWFKKKFLARHGQQGLHFVVADAVIWGAPWYSDVPFSQAFRIDWPPQADETTGQPTLSRCVLLPNRERFEVFPQALNDGGVTLRDATWRTPNRRAVPRAHRNKSGPIDPAWVRVDRAAARVTETTGDPPTERLVSDGKKGVWIDFPAESEPGRILAAGVTLSVRGKLYPGQTGRLGISQTFQIVTTDVGDPGLGNFIVAHEVGHNMRQSACRDTDLTGADNRLMYLPPGLEFSDHPTTYRGHGHMGPHCWFALDDAGATHVRNVKPDGTEEFLALSGTAHAQDDYSKLRKKDGETYVKVGGTCLMYGSAYPGTVENTVGFCEHCAKFAKAVSLEDIHKDGTVAAFDGEAEEDEVEDEAEPPEPLRIQLCDELYAPCANVSYELILPTETVSGTTDANGWLEQAMTPELAAGCTLTVKYTPAGESEALELAVHLAPSSDLDSDEAFMAHLRNFGYALDGEDQATSVARFQAAVGVAPTGQLDDPTKQAIDDLLADGQDDALKLNLFEEA